MGINGLENLSGKASVAPEPQNLSAIDNVPVPGTDIAECIGLTPPKSNTVSVGTKRDVKDETQISDKKSENNPQEKLILSQKFKEFFNKFMDMVKNLFGLDSTDTKELQDKLANLIGKDLDEIEKEFPSIMDDSKGISDFQVALFQKLFDIKDDKVARECLERFKAEQQDEPLILYAIEKTNSAISGTGNLVDNLTTEKAIQEALKKEGRKGF